MSYLEVKLILCGMSQNGKLSKAMHDILGMKRVWQRQS